MATWQAFKLIGDIFAKLINIVILILRRKNLYFRVVNFYSLHDVFLTIWALGWFLCLVLSWFF